MTIAEKVADNYIRKSFLVSNKNILNYLQEIGSGEKKEKVRGKQQRKGERTEMWKDNRDKKRMGEIKEKGKRGERWKEKGGYSTAISWYHSMHLLK